MRDSLSRNPSQEKCYKPSLENQDIDIATPESPEIVTRLLQDAGIKVYPTGINYGTVSAQIKDMKFEITTLRQDFKTDGRHASVAFINDWIIDAGRRDFTFNALSVTPEGDIYDFYDGISDLSHGLVRFIGLADEKINEDVLRILRFFRFFGYYGSSPADPTALTACRAHAEKLTRLSGERIWSEMYKILLAPEPGDIASLMCTSGVFNYILPEAKNIERMRWVVSLETRTFQMVTVVPDALRRLAALIDTDTEGAKKLSKRWRLSNREALRLISLAVPELTISPDIIAVDLKRALHRLGSEMIRDLALLAWAGELAITPHLTKVRTESWIAILKTCKNWEDVTFPLKGGDVTALGIEEGPRIGKLLACVEEWWEKGGYIAGRKNCLNRLASITGEN